MAPDVTKLFNKFAGKQVAPPMTAPFDPVTQEMQELAQANGYELRVLYNNDPALLSDYRTDRISVNVEQKPNGKYVVKDFTIG